MNLTFGSLFSGIGGLDLGFERAGFRCVWQVEIDPFCQRVLEKHWPTVKKHADIRTFTGEGFETPEIIVGGFPCQDVSLAGKREGLAGERSGLWVEFARIIREVRPRYVVVENVPGLLAYDTKKGKPAPIATVLTEFSRLGYDAEWGVVSARSVGSTQLRKRVFIITYPDSSRSPIGDGKRGDTRETESPAERFRSATGYGERTPFEGSGWWETEPPMARMVYGVPGRVVRDPIRGLGNAVVPQVAEQVAKRLRSIIEAHA